jgi:putative endonuclease
MASRRNGTLYLGVTSDLPKRAYEHRNSLTGGFSRRYGCKLLVWYAAFDDIQDARARELQMKKWKRDWKLQAIEQMNPAWRDLFEEIAL